LTTGACMVVWMQVPPSGHHVKLKRIQILVQPESADAIRSAAERERLAVSEYLRRVVDQHLDGQALIEPVRAALADAAASISQNARASLVATGDQILAEVRAEREENRKQIADFVDLLAGVLQTTPTAADVPAARPQPRK